MTPSTVTASLARCALLACIITLSACSRGRAQNVPRGDAPVPVVVARVERQAVPITLSAVGTVESMGSVVVQTRVDGQIVKVLVQDGQEVRAGQPLIQIDPQPLSIALRMAQATLARDAARLENTRAKMQRGQDLFAQKFISNDEFTQLKTDYDGAVATVDSDRATVDQARLQLDYATLVAPVSGKIGHIAQQVGNTVHAAAQTPLTTLNVLDTVDVSFAVPARELGRVRGALAGTAPQVQAVADGAAGKPTANGKLTFIDNAADPATGTIRLRARFDNHDRALWPGQFVTVSLNLPDAASIVVPNAAIAQGPAGSYVYVIGKDSIAEQRTVQVIRSTAAVTIVTGVEPGEQVVIDGQSRVAPDKRVTVRSPGSDA